MSARTSITDGVVMRRASLPGRSRNRSLRNAVLAALGLALALAPSIGFTHQTNAPAAAAAAAAPAPPAAPGTPTVSTPPAVPAPPDVAAMPAAPAAPTPIAGTGLLPADFSAWGMFLHADMVVKAVMIGLIFA